MELALSPDSPTVVKTKDEANKSLKYGIWAYFILIIFEGALRKWFLPGLATPLLVIRDPLAIWLIYVSWKRGLFPSSIYLYGMVIIGLAGLYTAMFAGHGNLVVALYGARIFLLHFPLIFVIGRVFDREDILKMAKVTLYISIPMVILVCKQFYSPQSAWVNRGVAGDMAGAGFGGVGDFKGLPELFHLLMEPCFFFGWLAPFVFYFWFNKKKIDIRLLAITSAALLIAIPFSISRTLLFEVSLTFVFALIGSLGKSENFNKVVTAVIVGIICLAVFSQTKYFNTATKAFSVRFSSANETEGGLVKGVIGDRFFGGMLGALAGSSQQPFWGYGIGMGTNVGSELLTGKRTFLIAELEWGRLIGELGPLMGILAIILRVGFALKLAIACIRKMAEGDLLPWLLLSFGFIVITQGQWAQPTSLGFCVMIGGLIIAALRSERIPEQNYKRPIAPYTV